MSDYTKYLQSGCFEFCDRTIKELQYVPLNTNYYKHKVEIELRMYRNLRLYGKISHLREMGETAYKRYTDCPDAEECAFSYGLRGNKLYAEYIGVKSKKVRACYSVELKPDFVMVLAASLFLPVDGYGVYPVQQNILQNSIITGKIRFNREKYYTCSSLGSSKDGVYSSHMIECVDEEGKKFGYSSLCDEIHNSKLFYLAMLIELYSYYSGCPKTVTLYSVVEYRKRNATLYRVILN